MDAHINAFGSTLTAPKKKVLFIVTQSEMGGAQQFILQFIKTIEKDTHDIFVATGSDGDGSLLKEMAKLSIPVFAISELKRNINPLSDFLAVKETANLIDKLKPDTLFLASSKAGFICSLAAKQSHTKPKVIYRIGGWSFNDPRPLWEKRLLAFLEKISASWKDVIIVNNTHDLNQAKEMGIKPKTNLLLVHNGLNPYKIEFLDRNEARAELVLPKDKKIIGTVANFYPAKGLGYLIEAAAKIKRQDALWCIIGDGEERKNLEHLIEDNGLKETVILAGRREEAPRYFNAFDVFLLPSVKEGFPWAVLEAMAAKLPVIATRVGAVPEIIENGVSGFIIDPANPDQIIEKVNYLLDNQSKAQEMGIQAHQRILFAFSTDSTIRQIEKLL